MEEKVLDTFIKTTFKGGRTYVEIYHPTDQEPIPITIQTYILTSAVSLLIKTTEYYDMEVKDYELMKAVVKHLESEFGSLDAFSDLALNTTKIKEG